MTSTSASLSRKVKRVINANLLELEPAAIDGPHALLLVTPHWSMCPFGTMEQSQEATNYVSNYLENNNNTVTLNITHEHYYDGGRHDTILADVFTSKGESICKHLLEAGYSWLPDRSYGTECPPVDYEKAYRQAVADKKGLWATVGPYDRENPAQYRKYLNNLWDDISWAFY